MTFLARTRPDALPETQPVHEARPLRVAHVVRQYAPARGGLETYVAELAGRQARRGYDVSVLTLDRVFGRAEVLPPSDVVDGIPVRRMRFVGHRKAFLPALDRSWLRTFDLIHVHATDQIVDLLALMALAGLPPIMLTTHGLFFHTEDLKRIKHAYLRTISRFTLRRIREIFAVSANDQAILRTIGIESTLLRNPVVPYAGPRAQGADLLYVGRISANKRMPHLIAFVRALRDLGAPTVLHVAGSDAEGLWPGVEAEIARLGVGDLVQWHGFVPDAQIGAIASSCGFAVSASRYEGYGLSIVEGMSVGLLPVVHRNAAFTETVQRSGCGLLLDFDDPGKAAAAFLAWAPMLTDADRDRAVAFARSQSWDAVIDALDARYHAALG
ncbi:MAG: glycosyltransferase family 4 protein [Alsobacter sp.]